MELKNYPKLLVKNREQIECNFIFCLWKDPSLIDDYKNVVNGTDIITEDGMFYYGICQQMIKAGIDVFDNISVETFLSDKEVLKKGFEERTGFRAVKEITELLNIENIDAYYEALTKNNMILNLYNEGFSVEKDWDKIKQMSSEELYDYYDYKLGNVCVGKIEKIKGVDLKHGYGDYIKQWDSGQSIGYKIGFPMLNYNLAGVHKKNLLLHLAHIGNGKTTSAINMYALPAIEEGENVCIIANEQDEDEWRQMTLASVLFNKTDYLKSANKKMNRQKFVFGHFTDEDKEWLSKATEWLDNQIGKLEFISLNDYSIEQVRKIVKKYSKIGYGEFIFDTLKPEQENSDKAWADFSEVAKELFMISKKEDVAIIATAQLSSESMTRRFLDLSCVGKAKAISETASTVVMFRSLTTEEKAKYKAYTFERDSSGKYSKKRNVIDLHEDRDYIVIFVPKNRFGSTKFQIVYERNMSFNTMREIGYIDIAYDGFRKK